MKRIFLFAATLLLAAACTKTEKPEEYGLEVRPAALSFDASENRSGTVSVTAENVSWTFAVEETATEWLEAEKADETTLKITATENAADTERTATVILSDPEGRADPVTVTVTQAAAATYPAATVTTDKTELSFGWEGGVSQQFTVTAPEGISWKAAADITAAGWLTAATEGNTVTVTAAENSSDEPRTGTINIRPSDEKVESASVTVTQQGCDQEPSLTLDKPELLFGANDTEPQVVHVSATRINSWDIQIDNPDTSEFLFAACDNEAGTVTVSVSRNFSTEPRTGTVTVKAGDAADAVITVTQEGSDSEAASTLTDDVTLTAENLAVSRITVYSDQHDAETQTTWSFEVHDEGCYLNPDTGWMTGTGCFMTLEFVSERPADYSVLPEGVYTVDGNPSYDTVTEQPLYAVPALAAGQYAGPGFYSHSSFVKYENGTETEGTPICGGTATVTRGGNAYTMVSNLKDDAGHTLSGTFRGAITEFVVY